MKRKKPLKITIVPVEPNEKSKAAFKAMVRDFYESVMQKSQPTIKAV